jgi:broad specificity phosphatase PhoE
MPTIYLVRHGKAAASFTDDPDPGLDATGHQQAHQAALLLKDKLPLNLVASPLRRARETALPLAQMLGQEIHLESRIAEIPSAGIALKERGPWLQNIMSGSWDQVDESLKQWKQDMIRCLLEVSRDTVFFSHFVAINALAGAAESREEVLIFRPDNGSITTIETRGQSLILVERGAEASTQVN